MTLKKILITATMLCWTTAGWCDTQHPGRCYAEAGIHLHSASQYESICEMHTLDDIISHNSKHREIMSSGLLHLSTIMPYLYEIAQDAKVPLSIAAAIAVAESHTSNPYNIEHVVLNPYAVNPHSGCKGLFQLSDSTARRMYDLYKLSGSYSPFNWKKNAKAGVNYIRYLDDIFSKPTALTKRLSTYPVENPISRMNFVIAAYNAGEGTIAKAQKKAEHAGLNPVQVTSIMKYIPTETRRYLNKVLNIASLYSAYQMESPT